ncbi:MAG: hypothetical protein ACR2PL_01795 [Dehalococcoidia bacterium]
MTMLGLFRFRFAVRFWRRVRMAGYFYVAATLVLAVIELIFHVRL